MQGVYPPFDALSSLSRLMRLGAGPSRTRDDHLAVAAQVYASLAQARRAADLAEIVGADALSSTSACTSSSRSSSAGAFCPRDGTRPVRWTRPSPAPGRSSPSCLGASSRCCRPSCSTATTGSRDGAATAARPRRPPLAPPPNRRGRARRRRSRPEAPGPPAGGGAPARRGRGGGGRVARRASRPQSGSSGPPSSAVSGCSSSPASTRAARPSSSSTGGTPSASRIRPTPSSRPPTGRPPFSGPLR